MTQSTYSFDPVEDRLLRHDPTGPVEVSIAEVSAAIDGTDAPDGPVSFSAYKSLEAEYWTYRPQSGIVQINITDDHIARGRRYQDPDPERPANCNTTPIALACGDVKIYDVYDGGETICMMRNPEPPYNQQRLKKSSSVVSWSQRFDERQPVEPFTLTLNFDEGVASGDM